MLRSVERIDSGSAKLRTELLQQLCVGEQLILEILIQRLKLHVKLFVEENGPRHCVLCPPIHMVASPYYPCSAGRYVCHRSLWVNELPAIPRTHCLALIGTVRTALDYIASSGKAVGATARHGDRPRRHRRPTCTACLPCRSSTPSWVCRLLRSRSPGRLRRWRRRSRIDCGVRALGHKVDGHGGMRHVNECADDHGKHHQNENTFKETRGPEPCFAARHCYMPDHSITGVAGGCQTPLVHQSGRCTVHDSAGALTRRSKAKGLHRCRPLI